MANFRTRLMCIDSGKVINWNWGIPAPFLYHAKLIVHKQEINREFWEIVPSGTLEFNSTEPIPVEVGAEYYIDISPVESLEEKP